MAISNTDLEHLCQLAKLSLDEKIQEKLTGQLKDILNYMDTLSEVDTKNVEPLYSPVLRQSNLCYTREDLAKLTQSPESILANAPQTDGNYFIVPRIVEGK